MEIPELFGKIESRTETGQLMKIATYWILFLGQTVGDLTILSHLIPLLRRLFTSGLHEKAPSKIFVYAALGVTLIQVCYWLNQRWFATLRVGQNPLLGHLVLFLSRLNFIFAGAMFSAVYLTRLHFGVSHYSLPCCSRYSATRLNLSGFGKALIKGKDRS